MLPGIDEDLLAREEVAAMNAERLKLAEKLWERSRRLTAKEH
jgi:hypothetical protein